MTATAATKYSENDTKVTLNVTMRMCCAHSICHTLHTLAATENLAILKTDNEKAHPKD